MDTSQYTDVEPDFDVLLSCLKLLKETLFYTKFYGKTLQLETLETAHFGGIVWRPCSQNNIVTDIFFFQILKAT